MIFYIYLRHILTRVFDKDWYCMHIYMIGLTKCCQRHGDTNNTRTTLVSGIWSFISIYIIHRTRHVIHVINKTVVLFFIKIYSHTYIQQFGNVISNSYYNSYVCKLYWIFQKSDTRPQIINTFIYC